MPRRLRSLLLGVIVAAGSGILPATPAAASVATVTSGDSTVLFLRPNLDPVPDSVYATPDPGRNGARFLPYQTPGLRDQIADLVALAAPGSTVYGSLYTFSDQGITDNLLAAHARGVSVRLIVEACTSGTTASCGALSNQVNRLVTELGSYRVGAGGSWTWQCRISCSSGGTGINHNKFWVFSELSDGRTDVTVVSSANPTKPQQQMWQNQVRVDNDPALASAFRSYVGRKLQVTGTAKSYERGHVDAGSTRLWFSPRELPSASESATIAESFNPQSSRSDIVAAAIDDVQCSTGSSDDIIRMAMWGFRAARPEVIDALGDKQAAGCTVEVATGEHQDALPGLTARGIGVYAMDPGGCRQSFFTVEAGVNGECSDGSIHSKYLLVQGVSRKDNQPHRYVYTGTQNLTNGALKKNDETFMRLDNPEIYDGFVADFNAIKNAAVTISPDRYPNAGFATANAVATGDQFTPAVASIRDSAGRNVTVSAFASGTASGLNNEIRLGRFVDGVRRSEVVVRTGGSTRWNYRTPDVGLASTGDAVVTWADDSNGNGGYEIRARRVRPDGTLGPVVNVNSIADGDQSEPSIAVLPDGRYAVTWQDVSTAGASSIRYASFSASDARLSPLTGGYDAPVQAVPGGTYRKPDVAVTSAGTVAIAWEDDEDGNGGYSIRAKTGTLAGAFGGTVAVHTGSLSDGQQRDPAVAVAESGTWYVAWYDGHTGRTGYDGNPQSQIYVRGFTGSTAAFAPRTISGPIHRWSTGANGAYQVITQTPYQSDRVGRQARPDIAVDGSGNAVVTWQESGQVTGLTSASSGTEVWARGIGPDGTNGNTFPESRLSVFTANRQDQPAIGMDPTGMFTVVYADDWDGNGGTQLKIRYGLRNCAQTC
ncbi:phospholipase D-like domain-containing protein [Plantactinospora sp. B6F1]|uniref:phospholipase D-like domain-containing protein n=1 Tax=Plantactinospora sp. B6F1 TaxID=3158971 RepID=UPI0032D90242